MAPIFGYLVSDGQARSNRITSCSPTPGSWPNQSIQERFSLTHLKNTDLVYAETLISQNSTGSYWIRGRPSISDGRSSTRARVSIHQVSFSKHSRSRG